MLEDFAFSFTSQNIIILAAWGVAVYSLGIAMALWMRRHSVWSLKRMPYFLALSGLFVVLSALPMAMLASFTAMKNGVLWSLIALIFLALAACGYIYGLLSHARAVSVDGEGKIAWIAILPIACLYLWFKAPLHKDQNRSFARVTVNVLGIILGIFLFLLGQSIAIVRDKVLSDMTARGANDLELQSINIKYMIRKDGLEATLQEIASHVAPEKLNDMTTLVRGEASAKIFKYIYFVETDNSALPESFRRQVSKGACATETLSILMKAGATVEYVYFRPDGMKLGTVPVTQAICEAAEREASKQTDQADIYNAINDTPAGDIYRALQIYYPEEARHFIEKIEKLLVAGTGEEEMRSGVFTLVSEIRRRHAAGLRAAPERTLSDVLRYKMQFFAAYDDRPMLCNRVIIYGARIIPEDERHHIVVIQEISNSLFRAMYEGEKSPVKRARSTPGDWEKLIANFQAAGGTKGELDLVTKMDAQNPQFCGAMQRFLSVLIDSDFPGSDRIKAEIAMMFNGS